MIARLLQIYILQGDQNSQRGTSLAPKIGPAELILVAKVVWGTKILVTNSAKFGPSTLTLGGTDFGMTVQS